MACFCMRVEFVPSIISSLLTTSGAALSIVFGMLHKRHFGGAANNVSSIVLYVIGLVRSSRLPQAHFFRQKMTLPGLYFMYWA